MAEELTAIDTDQGQNTLNCKYLTFAIENEEYGIEIRDVTEIIGIQTITGLPDTPQYIKGVINLRGKVVPVIDVRLRFNFEERGYDDRTCIIVVNINNSSIGLIVDTVSEVIDIPSEDVDPPQLINKDSENRYIAGFGKFENKVKILLNTKKLLFDEDLPSLQSRQN